MTELSPAAQAVLDAAMNTPEEMPYEHDIAAALRAAADQVVPDETGMGVYLSGSELQLFFQRREIRRQLLAIAAKLEAKQSHESDFDYQCYIEDYK